MAKTKTKTLGKSSLRGVPEDEIVLAEAIQNAEAFGMDWCQGVYYRGWNGGSLSYSEKDKATACCAVGALCLTARRAPFDPRNKYAKWTGIPRGNDTPHYNGDPAPGEDIGAAFRDYFNEH